MVLLTFMREIIYSFCTYVFCFCLSISFPANFEFTSSKSSVQSVSFSEQANLIRLRMAQEQVLKYTLVEGKRTGSVLYKDEKGFIYRTNTKGPYRIHVFCQEKAAQSCACLGVIKLQEEVLVIKEGVSHSHQVIDDPVAELKRVILKAAEDVTTIKSLRTIFNEQTR
jgi:hypothetical protein